MGDRRRTAALALVAALVLAACGSDENDTGPPTQVITEVPSDRVLAGVVREPAPDVSATTLVSFTYDGEELEFRAEPGELLVVYFGYTNCPDVCPTTMFDHTVAMRRLPDEVAERIHTVMVTVDPERDAEILTDYVRSFVPDGEGAGTDDPDRLAAAAEPFGATYEIVETSTGEIEVSHSGFLYAVNDQGRLVVAWPFGTSSEEMAADMFQLLQQEAGA